MKKIGEIKGVPVVEGNINEVTKNQIHYKEDSGNIQLSKRGNDNKLNSVTGSSDGSSSKYTPRYYKINNELDHNLQHTICVSICSTVKYIDVDKSDTYITNTNVFNNFKREHIILGFMFVPVKVDPVDGLECIDTIYTLIDLIEQDLGIDIKQYITEITEEEYYKID